MTMHDTETKNKEPASLTTVVCQAFRLSLSAVLLFVFGDCKLETPSRNRMAEDRCSSSAKQARISSQLSIPVTVRCCRMDHLCFACAPSFSTLWSTGRRIRYSPEVAELWTLAFVATLVLSPSKYPRNSFDSGSDLIRSPERATVSGYSLNEMACSEV